MARVAASTPPIVVLVVIAFAGRCSGRLASSLQQPIRTALVVGSSQITRPRGDLATARSDGHQELRFAQRREPVALTAILDGAYHVHYDSSSDTVATKPDRLPPPAPKLQLREAHPAPAIGGTKNASVEYNKDSTEEELEDLKKNNSTLKAEADSNNAKSEKEQLEPAQAKKQAERDAAADAVGQAASDAEEAGTAAYEAKQAADKVREPHLKEKAIKKAEEAAKNAANKEHEAFELASQKGQEESKAELEADKKKDQAREAVVEKAEAKTRKEEEAQQKVPEVASIKFFLAEAGKNCLPGQEITDAAQCQIAYKYLNGGGSSKSGVGPFKYPSKRGLVQGSWPALPPKCSVQFQNAYVEQGKDVSPHWNGAISSVAQQTRLLSSEFRAICYEL